MAWVVTRKDEDGGAEVIGICETKTAANILVEADKLFLVDEEICEDIAGVDAEFRFDIVWADIISEESAIALRDSVKK